MAHKHSNPLSYLFILIIFLEILHAKSSHYSKFESIKDLQGSRKGDEIEGLNQVKKYLKRFGYIEGDVNSADSNIFDDVLESALKLYQSFFHLNSSGVLDNETLAQMGKPRCGMPDIVNHHKHNHSHNHNHTNMLDGLKYSFFDGRPRWPLSQGLLKYAFWSSVPSTFGFPIERALLTWGLHVPFEFSKTSDYTAADIHIDYRYIDRNGGTLAYAFEPDSGYVRFDNAENWYTSYFEKPPKDMVDLYSVALHEFGHTLGLDHSTVKTAIMFPSIDSGETKVLDFDDIEGVQKLYFT